MTPCIDSPSAYGDNHSNRFERSHARGLEIIRRSCPEYIFAVVNVVFCVTESPGTAFVTRERDRDHGAGKFQRLANQNLRVASTEFGGTISKR